MNPSRRLILPRRSVIRGLLSLGAFGVTSQFWTGCTAPSSTSSSGESASPSTASIEPMTIGFIYVGPKDDYGYNQAHAEAAARMASAFPWIKLVEEASVPETTAVQETMRNMIEQDGAKVIFPTSWGYFDPHSLKLAAEYPEVQFFHPNHPLEPSHPKNVGTYFSALMEPAYLTGIVAASMSKTGKLGFVIPKPIPVVLQEVNSFTLGAKSINPDITVQAIFTGDWSLPLKEAEATNSLIDQQVDVVITRVDSPKTVITTAEQRGIYSCGYHVNEQSIAPKGFLTGVEWNWEQIYKNYAELFQNGKTLTNGGVPQVVAGGLKESFSKISDYGVAVSPEAKAAVDQAKQQLISGELTIFKGELKDNKGNVVIPSGEAYQPGDARLNSIDWLVEGIEGQPTS
ncbi:MAG: BMP family ABC transporter substrate-binding protein [Oculatellaceae cyanobacterium bins.114]|nr:BMP family ABC transporter substrate-binding protein [Oculatellaceae cyanobacterium bins.114]